MSEAYLLSLDLGWQTLSRIIKTANYKSHLTDPLTAANAKVEAPPLIQTLWYLLSIRQPVFYSVCTGVMDVLISAQAFPA